MDDRLPPIKLSAAEHRRRIPTTKERKRQKPTFRDKAEYLVRELGETFGGPFEGIPDDYLEFHILQTKEAIDKAQDELLDGLTWFKIGMILAMFSYTPSIPKLRLLVDFFDEYDYDSHYTEHRTYIWSELEDSYWKYHDRTLQQHRELEALDGYLNDTSELLEKILRPLREQYDSRSSTESADARPASAPPTLAHPQS